MVRPAQPTGNPILMSAEDAVEKIAKTLGESEEIPLKQIGQILESIGEERTMQLIAETLEIESKGGLMVPDGSRRRSPGGVFFNLVRQVLPREEKQRIFYSQAQGQAPKRESKAKELEAEGGASDRSSAEKGVATKARRPRIIEVAKDLGPKRRKTASYPPKAPPPATKEGARERIKQALSGLPPLEQRDLLLELIADVRPND